MRPLTRSCFLLLLLRRTFLRVFSFLLGICPCSPWSPPLLVHALVLIPLSLTEVQVSPTLSLSLLMIWYSRQTALFLFLLVRVAPAFLPTALSVALRPFYSFRSRLWHPLVQTVDSCPAFGAPWFSAMPPSLGRGRVNNNNINVIENILGRVIVCGTSSNLNAR